MAIPTIVDSVATDPGGTGSSITPVLPTHAANDGIIIFIPNTGNTAYAGNPAGWSRVDQRSVGTSSNGIVGTWLYRRVLPGDSIPLANPVVNLGATVTRHAHAITVRGADMEGMFTLLEWGARGFATGTSNPIRPPTVTTLAPEMLVLIGYGQRAATNAPDQTGYTQDEEIITSGTLVSNLSHKTVADQGTALSNQDASPTSGARWVAGILCIPSADYVYYRSGAQATATGTSATPALPTGTSSSDWRLNKDLVIATVEAAGTPTISPQVGADWTEITGFANTTSGNGSTVRKYWALYDGTLSLQFNRSTSGEISVCLTTYRNTHQSTPIGAVNNRQNASSTTSTWDALTRTNDRSTMQATCVADATPTYTSPSGWTERMDGLGITCADQVFNASGSTASAAFTLSAASPTLVGLVEIQGLNAALPLTLSLSDDGNTLSDGLVNIVGAASAQADSLQALTEELAHLLSYELALADSEAANWADAHNLLLAQFLALADNSDTLADASVLSLEQILTLTDNLDLSDEVLLRLDFALELTDDVNTLNDLSELLLAHNLSLSDSGQAFPSTSILDNFNRANEGPPPSSNWTTGIASAYGGILFGHSVTGSQLFNSFEQPAQDYWNVAEFGPDCEAYISIVNGSGLLSVSLVARLTNVGPSTSDGYAIQIDPAGNNRNYTIFRIDNGALTGLAATVETGVGSITGAKYGIQIIGTRIFLWGDTGSGWEVKLSASDSTYSAAGFIGIATEVESTLNRFDDFGGGTLVNLLQDSFTQELTELGADRSLTQSDTLPSLGDALGIGHGLVFSDSLEALSDTLALQSEEQSSFADTLALSDTETHTLSLEVSLADTVSLTDEQTSIVGLDQSLADTLSLSDSISLLLGYELSTDDSVDILADNYTQILTSLLTLSDLLILTDSTALGYGLLVSDDINFLIDAIETSAPQGPLREIGITEALTAFSDALAQRLDHLLDLTDSVSLTDAVALEESAQLALSDTLSLSDAESATLDHLQPLTDSFTLSDSVQLRLGYELATSDSVVLSDSIAIGFSYRLELTDNAALLVDSEAQTLGLALILAENGPIFTESIEFFSAWQLRSSDTLTLTDSLTKFSEGFLPLDDSISLNDTVAVELRGPDLNESLSDSLVFDDAISLALADELQLQIALADTVVLSDHYFDLRFPYTPNLKRNTVVPSQARTTTISSERLVIVPARNRTTTIE